jgi:hypothetical protein
MLQREKRQYWDVQCTPHLEVIEQDKVLAWYGDWCVVHYPAEGDNMEQFCVMKRYRMFTIAGFEDAEDRLMGVLHYAYEDLLRQDDPEGIHKGNAVRFAFYQARRSHRIQQALNQRS